MTSTPTAAKPKRPRFYSITVETEVDLDDIASDLAEAGWHHQDDCPSPAPLPAAGDAATMRAAVESLHRQAHPSQHREPFMCREEPCRSLTLDQLRPVAP